MEKFANKVALVTGGSRGIGRSIALELAKSGATVAVNYRERVADAEAVAAEVRTNGGRAEVFCANVSSRTAVNEMVAAVEGSLGLIDILVNNAGVAATGGGEVKEEDFDRIVAANLKSAFLCTEAVLLGMRERHWGRIANISAMGARAGSSNVAYGASKAGLEGLTRSYALQFASDGVTFDTVAPGLIDTEMSKSLIDAGAAVARIPVRRAGRADEIAGAVMFVLSNSFLTGQTVSVNGGLYLA